MAFIASTMVPAAAVAAPLNIGDDQVPFEELILEADQSLGGRAIITSGDLEGDARYFFVPGIDVMSPTVVTVFTENAASPVKVSLHRHYWNRPDLEAETDATGTWRFTGRIDDSIGIALSADAPTDFVMLFWTGDSVPPEVPPILFDGGRPVAPAQGE
ncbi:hypothetical protein SLH47_18215 [Cognatiyoonia sp. IB215182]|nr:hypothetical protein [Cognatiyoonia sp. IB215182]